MEKTLNISDDGRKRLLQSGFLAGLKYLDNKYSFVKELPEKELEEIKEALGHLFEEYGLSKEIM